MKKWHPLLWSGGLVALIIALPIIALGSWLGTPTLDVWQHLSATVLPDYIFNSLILASACMVCTLVVGTVTAWLCSSCTFKGQSFYRWALVLPLAYPAYIIAYIYTGTLDYGGNIYVLLHSYGIIEKPFAIRSMMGAIIVLSITLYPYVYLLAYSTWRNNSGRLFETARLLHAQPHQLFLRVALPVARPAIVAGIAIVGMEALSDYGAVHYFGVSTLSLGIIEVWFGLNTLATAAQISFILLLAMLVLVGLEKRARKSALYSMDYTPRHRPLYHLHSWKAVLAHIVCALPVLLGFVGPTVLLIHWTLMHVDADSWNSYRQLWTNTVSIALLATAFIVLCAIILSYIKRNYHKTKLSSLVQIVSSGYVIPGVVVAAAVMSLNGIVQHYSNWLLSGSLLALVLAYTVRFITPGFNAIGSGLEKIPKSLDDSAKILGSSDSHLITRIHIPLITPAVITAALLVFVDIIKELPMTLTLRPFNFNTFSVKAYELASDERITEIGFPALNIMLIGLIPLFIFMRSQHTRH